MKKANNISWGLFNYHGCYWLRNIKHIPIWFKRIIFTLKHGYVPQARWETFAWFMDTMTEILKWYRNNRTGTPYELDEKEYDEVLDHMINLLAAMDEDNPLYKNWNWSEKSAAMDNAKEEFFKLFNQYFYNLWD